LIQDALPQAVSRPAVFPSGRRFPGNTDRKMLENFVNINQFPSLVKQQGGQLFRIFLCNRKKIAITTIAALQPVNLALRAYGFLSFFASPSIFHAQGRASYRGKRLFLSQYATDLLNFFKKIIHAPCPTHRFSFTLKDNGTSSIFSPPDFFY